MGTRQLTSREQDLQLDTEKLRAKQSVRTTFKLREKTINLLKVSAKHLGIKQKTLLDQLLEDGKALELLTDDAVTHTRNENDCRPKTFVLSKNALDQVEDVSSRCTIPRDFLVEQSVSRLASYVDALAETHDKRRKVLNDLERYREHLEALSAEASAMLNEDDAFVVKMEDLTKRTRKYVEEIKKTVKENNEFIY